MSRPVLMPRLGESVTEGTIVRWLKNVGDFVNAGEPLAEVSTDKVNVEIEAPVSGTLLAIKAGLDETVAVGVELATLGESGEAGQAEDEPEALSDPAPGIASATAGDLIARPENRSGGPSGTATSRTQATPVARRLAHEHGVDLSTVSGSGPYGRIRKNDILGFVDRHAGHAAATHPALTSLLESRDRIEPMSRMRQVIAARMMESLQTSAQLTTVVEADVTRIARLRERAKRDFEAREGVKLSFLPFFALATLQALKQHPIINASIDVDAKAIVYHGSQHLGIAVDTARGLLVPVIHDAGTLSLAGLAQRIDDLARRARSQSIGPDDLSGGTFTITNTGSRGALFDTPIVNQPQSAILGLGSVTKRVAVVDDADLGEIIAIRSFVYLALSYDHRIIDGADAARFLTSLKGRLESGIFEGDIGL